MVFTSRARVTHNYGVSHICERTVITISYRCAVHTLQLDHAAVHPLLDEPAGGRHGVHHGQERRQPGAVGSGGLDGPEAADGGVARRDGPGDGRVRRRPVRGGQRARRQAAGVVAGGVAVGVRGLLLARRRHAHVHAARRDVRGQRQDQGGPAVRHVVGRRLVRPGRHLHHRRPSVWRPLQLLHVRRVQPRLGRGRRLRHGRDQRKDVFGDRGDARVLIGAVRHRSSPAHVHTEVFHCTLTMSRIDDVIIS